MNLAFTLQRPFLGLVFTLWIVLLTLLPPIRVAVAQSPSRAAPIEERLLAKADELIRLGDIAAARLVLEHLVQEGSGAAAFKLAETYDYRRLSDWGVRGLRDDPVRARELYGQAYGNGIKEAEERLDSLR